jgi:hypothetical protein
MKLLDIIDVVKLRVTDQHPTNASRFEPMEVYVLIQSVFANLLSNKDIISRYKIDKSQMLISIPIEVVNGKAVLPEIPIHIENAFVTQNGVNIPIDIINEDKYQEYQSARFKVAGMVQKGNELRFVNIINNGIVYLDMTPSNISYYNNEDSNPDILMPSVLIELVIDEVVKRLIPQRPENTRNDSVDIPKQ